MSRKKISKKRFPQVNPIYNNNLVSLLLSKILKSGKKTLAQRILVESFEIIKNRTQNNPIKILEKAVRNTSPSVEVKSKHFSNSVIQIPVNVTGFRATNLALRWIIKYAGNRNGKTITINLANEIIDASNEIGNSVKKKQEVHKIAEANKAFTQYRS
jgi:small subunit ribosomal protein S7